MQQRACRRQVTAGCQHRITDGRDQARAEVEFVRKQVDCNAEMCDCAVHGSVTSEMHLVSALVKRQCRREQRLQVTARATGRDDEDSTHRATATPVGATHASSTSASTERNQSTHLTRVWDECK